MQTKKRPTAALLELPDPYSDWNGQDYRLEEASLVLDREICKSCGSPVWLCHTASNAVGFEVRSGWCYGKAEIEDYNESNEAPKLEAGEYRYAVAVGAKTGVDDERDPLPRRSEALDNLASVVRKAE